MAFNFVQRLRTSKDRKGWTTLEYIQFLARMKVRLNMEMKLAREVYDIETKAEESVSLASIKDARIQELHKEFDDRWNAGNSEDIEEVASEPSEGSEEVVDEGNPQ